MGEEDSKFVNRDILMVMGTVEGHFQGGSAKARRAVECHMWVLGMARGEVGWFRIRVFLVVARSQQRDSPTKIMFSCSCVGRERVCGICVCHTVRGAPVT